jgi:hypothetical protein
MNREEQIKMWEAAAGVKEDGKMNIKPPKPSEPKPRGFGYKPSSSPSYTSNK